MFNTMAGKKNRLVDSFYFKTPRNERFSEMTKQEQLIAQKKLEIQAKLEMKNRPTADEELNKESSASKPKTPSSNVTPKESASQNNIAAISNNIFSNDGSFLEQFKKLVNENTTKEKETSENSSVKNDGTQETYHADQNQTTWETSSNDRFEDQTSKRLIDHNRKYDNFRRNDNRWNDNRRNDEDKKNEEIKRNDEYRRKEDIRRNDDGWRNEDNRRNDRKYDHEDRRRRFDNERHDNRNRRFDRDRMRHDDDRDRRYNDYDDYDRSRRYDRFESQKSFYDDKEQSRRNSWNSASSLNDNKYGCNNALEQNERNIPPWESNALKNQQQQQSLANSSIIQYQPTMTVPVSSIILSSTMPVPVSITTYVSSLPVTLPTDSVTYPSVQIQPDTTVPVITQQIPLQQQPSLILQPINQQQVSINQPSPVTSMALSQTPTLTHVAQPSTLITVPQSCSVSSVPQSSTINPVPSAVLNTANSMNPLTVPSGNSVVQQCQSTMLSQPPPMSQTSIPPQIPVMQQTSMQIQQMPSSTQIYPHPVPPPPMNPHPVPPPSTMNTHQVPPSPMNPHGIPPPASMNPHPIPSPSMNPHPVPPPSSMNSHPVPPQSAMNSIAVSPHSTMNPLSAMPQPSMNPMNQHSLSHHLTPQTSISSLPASAGGPPPVAYPLAAIPSQPHVPGSAQNSFQSPAQPPVQQVFNQQTMSASVPDMSVPPPMVMSDNKLQKLNDTLDIGAHRSAEMEQIAVIVAQQGDQMEDVLLQENPHDPKYWFLHEKQSFRYMEFRQLVDKLRCNPLSSNPIKMEQTEYEESSQYCGIAIKKEFQLENDLRRKADDDGSDRNERRKKRRSRWAPEGCKVDMPAAPALLLPNAVQPPTLPAAVNTKNLPGVPNAMISQIQRADPALLQYAVQSFGTTNLSEEDWKKCEDHYKINLLYQDMLRKRKEIERLRAAGKFKYEYDSDEETEGGTWEHKLRRDEMVATQLWADELTEKSKGKHHIGDFLPPDELERFLEKYSALKEGREPDLSDYKEFKLREDNIGFQMLQKLGWSEGKGLGFDGSGIVDPVNKASTRVDNQGLGVEKPAEVNRGDDEYDAYRKRMMLAYRFRPNPLNNPRRPYY